VTQDLHTFVAEGLSYLRRKADIGEAELFASINSIATCRINYTAHIPCNGLEEPKSSQTRGVGLRVAFKNGSGIRIGFGQETGSLTLEGVESAYLKAREGAVFDPDFHGLPAPAPTTDGRLRNYHDPALLSLADADLVDIGWKTINCALEEFERSPLLRKHSPRALGLILGGDVTLLQEQVALASTSLRNVEDDTTTALFSSLTAMIENMNSKGSGWSAATHLHGFDGSAGSMAVRNSLRSAGGGTRVAGGTHRVVLSPQAVADIMSHIVIPSLRLDTFYVGNSAYQGRLGMPIASDLLSVSDIGNEPNLTASKGITCEGLPTGTTELIAGGRLAGLLSNDYETKRMLRDGKARDKLGVDPHEWQHAIMPRNGFRFGEGGGRHHDAMPSISPTNIVIEGSPAAPLDEMLALIKDGIYVGRIWYTYPINGIKAGDFTSTVVGDSYLIRDGQLAEPLEPNTVRINDTIHSVLNRIACIENKRTAIVLWAADEVFYAPHIALEALTLSAIGTTV
jgi:PmbA protein